MPNFTLKNNENLSSLSNLANEIKYSTFRTGGTVSNFSNSKSTNGYGFNFWQLLFNGGKSLIPLFNQQLGFKKNYLDTIGEVVKGNDIIYVVNIFESLDNTLEGIKILKNHSCNIVALELGNEQYFKTRGLNVKQYLDKCKAFESLSSEYTLLYQLTTTKPNHQWNDLVISKDRQYSYHDYSETYFDFLDNVKKLTSKTHLSNIWLTEWNNKDAFSDTASYYAYVSDVLSFCKTNGLKNSFHNFIGDTWGILSDDLKVRDKLMNIFQSKN